MKLVELTAHMTMIGTAIYTMRDAINGGMMQQATDKCNNQISD